VQYSAELFLSDLRCISLVLVVREGDAGMLPGWITNHPHVTLCIGGTTRQESVQNGLATLAALEGTVLIHDAARPLLTSRALDALLGALNERDGAILGRKITDTVKQTAPDGSILTTLDRNQLMAAETPQAFNLRKIRKAYHDFRDINVTDDSALAELAGLNTTLVENPDVNFKITLPGDFALAEAVLLQRSTPPKTTTCIGQGIDVHAFYPGKQVVLGGVSIPHTQSLAGHSDADVLLHALTDALLGTIAAGDIGDHFPPSDPQWRGANSEIFVKKAMELVRQAGGAINNVDITVICEAPKIAPHRAAIQRNIAKLLDIPNTSVSIKATTSEKLGFTGRGEGIAAFAMVSVTRYLS
jgi:2-C-methyl-D-erythritol 4-phosphate cytidylyltransferase / 2-C-methyl-D-erythritol 2,4-cyclodiphosphate synthase